MNELDTAKVHQLDEYLSWYQNLSVDEATDIAEKLEKIARPKYTRELVPEYEAIRNLFRVQGTNGGQYLVSQHENAWKDECIRNAAQIRRFVEFAEEFKQPIYIGKWFDECAYLHMGNPERGIIICDPQKYIERIPAKDYSDITPAALRVALDSGRETSGPNLIPAESEQSMTQSGLREQLLAQENTISSLEQEIDDAKHARTGELAELQAQIEALKKELDIKKDKLMEELNEKKLQMEELKYQLEGQIYLLDSQIYAIRCFAGEIVKFGQIRAGQKASMEEPVIVHQKLRFLDEDLGKLASLYSIGWDDIGMFEEFLKHSPIALDTFAPNERCIVLVRLSRNGKYIGRTDDLPYSNLLKMYDYYHGKTVGIIIRNGENVWLGWTDEERVHIDDDLIINKAITIAEQPAEMPQFTFESERKQYIQQERKNRKRILDGIVSRAFVYNILQGIIEHTDMLPLPAGVNLSQQSKYVQYAVADTWLEDTRFGSFTDIVNRCNTTVKEGDMLLTCQRLVPEHGYDYGRYSFGIDRPWHNSRGRGERNRTHDCSVADCTIYPANVVEYDPPVAMVRYKYPEDCGYNKGPFVSEADRFYNNHNDFRNAIVLEEYQTEPIRHVFVSVVKENTWYYGRQVTTPARANFEVYDSEFINLTYLNSVWLEYVINTKTLGGWLVGGKTVDYAYAIRYLKTALDYIKKREAKERELLDAINSDICKDTEWSLKLSEWKLAKKVRKLTPYQAKRFANNL